MAQLEVDKSPWWQRIDEILNYDFCPDYNKYVYWMKHPLVGIIVASFAAGMCGLFVAPQAWMLCLGLAALSLIGLAWPAISVWLIDARLKFAQAYAEEGKATRVEIEILNLAPWPVWGLSLSGGFGEENEIAFRRANGWRTTKLVWQLTPQQRGVYPIDDVSLKTGFPFGIWTARRKVRVEGDLIVRPLPVQLDCVPDFADGRAADDVYSDRRVGDAGDITGTRLFRRGDSLRRVHWSLTARMNELICCERQAGVQSTARVVLAAERDLHAGTGSNSSLEWAIRIFAGICRELLRQGICVQAQIGCETIAIPAGSQGMTRLLNRLARLPLHGIETTDKPKRANGGEGLQIQITTNRAANSEAVRQGLTVVLQAEAFESDQAEAVAEQRESHPIAKRGTLTVESPANARNRFKADWRRLCHAVS